MVYERRISYVGTIVSHTGNSTFGRTLLYEEVIQFSYNPRQLLPRGLVRGLVHRLKTKLFVLIVSPSPESPRSGNNI